MATGRTDDNPTNFHWPPLESNPEIFETYMGSMGLPTESWGFSELFGLDEDLLGFVPQPVLAVIVNFEPVKPEAERERGEGDNSVVVQFGNLWKVTNRFFFGCC